MHSASRGQLHITHLRHVAVLTAGVFQVYPRQYWVRGSICEPSGYARPVLQPIDQESAHGWGQLCVRGPADCQQERSKQTKHAERSALVVSRR